MKKNKSGISVSNDIMQTFIWMSYRYCIGRKTAAASMHVDSIARLLRDNPNILNDDDMLFMSQDIPIESFIVTNKSVNRDAWMPFNNVKNFD